MERFLTHQAFHFRDGDEASPLNVGIAGILRGL